MPVPTSRKRTFTFDTNCLIDLDEVNRPAKPHVNSLIDAHRSGKSDVCFVTVSASELQKGKTYIDSYADFSNRLQKLNIADIPQIPGLFYLDLSFFDVDCHISCSDNDPLVSRERQIHNVLFPTVPFEFSDYAKSLGKSTTQMSAYEERRWINIWCDRQMFWSHDYHSRDVFVTSDKNFKKLVGQPGFGRAKVCTPKEALEHI